MILVDNMNCDKSCITCVLMPWIYIVVTLYDKIEQSWKIARQSYDHRKLLQHCAEKTVSGITCHAIMILVV